MAGNSLPSLSHAFRQSLWPLWDRRTMWAVLALLALIGGIYLWYAGEITAINHRISQLDEYYDDLQRREAEVQTEISALASAAALAQRAQALGFATPQAEIYLEIPAGTISTEIRELSR